MEVLCQLPDLTIGVQIRGMPMKQITFGMNPVKKKYKSANVLENLILITKLLKMALVVVQGLRQNP